MMSYLGQLHVLQCARVLCAPDAFDASSCCCPARVVVADVVRGVKHAHAVDDLRGSEAANALGLASSPSHMLGLCRLAGVADASFCNGNSCCQQHPHDVGENDSRASGPLRWAAGSRTAPPHAV